MTKATFILGVDVSKKTLDIYSPECDQHLQITNTTEGFRLLHQWCRLHGVNLKDTLVVLEYTGGYEYRLLQHLTQKKIAFVRIPGLALKRSLGITRGKSDALDCARIARYGRINQKDLRPHELNATLLELRQRLSFRKRVVRDLAADKTTLGERRHMKELKKDDAICRWLSRRIRYNERLLKEVKESIEKLIRADEDLWLSYRLLSSIKGIGPVNAWMTIAYTENFTSFTDPRKYAVYVGVVPFEHSSGTSIGGRKRISHLANKELKAELDCAARAAIQHDPELRQYAAAKRKEGKAEKLIRNNVRFKLIVRMFAIVKRGTEYVENYQKAA
ncbi:MAG: IS110 family transposase [Chitinophagaceae bacterium]|nr:MAG: IS110 family transposase [Chitinophagaceae bacterium]